MEYEYYGSSYYDYYRSTPEDAPDAPANGNGDKA
jgi:hypothetical protein